MNEFINKYFIIGSEPTNAMIVAFWLCLVLSSMMGSLGYVLTMSSMKTRYLILSFIPGALAFLFGMWLVGGESVWWSAPIGEWLRERVQ